MGSTRTGVAITALLLALVTGCTPPRAGAGAGEACERHADCGRDLVCHEQRCTSRAGIERAFEAARVQHARVQLAGLLDALAIYHVEHGRWPATLEELVDARLVQRLEPDPWGEPLRFVVHGPEHYELRSSGPDRRAGTGDDIVYLSDP